MKTLSKIFTLSLEQLCEIVEPLKISRTIDSGGLLIHEGTHPQFGLCMTIQDAMSGEQFLVRH